MVKILFYNATNPTDPDVFSWGHTRSGHSEFLVPVKARDGTNCTSTLDEGDAACHSKRLTSELCRTIEDALDKEVSLSRGGEGSFPRFDDLLSELPLIMQQFKEVKHTVQAHV